MSVDITPSSPSTYLDIIQSSIQDNHANRPQAEELVDALLNAETAMKKQRILYDFQDLTGKWRLHFATGTRKVRQRGGILLGKGFYLPKFLPAYISFQPSDTTPNQGTSTNQIELAGFRLKLTGFIKYLGKKNLLAFDFHTIEISLFNRIIYQGNIGGNKTIPDRQTDFFTKPIAKLSFFAFFLVTPDLIAARGRGGGLAIWKKQSDR